MTARLTEFITGEKLLQVLPDMKSKKCFICAPRMFIFHLIIAFISRMMELLWDLLRSYTGQYIYG